MSDTIARGVIEVEVNDSGVDAGIAKIERSVANLGKVAGAAGKTASDGINKIGAGSDKVAGNLDKATRNISGSIQRQIAAMDAGAKGSAKYYEALANARGANTATLKPLLDQLDAVTNKTKLAADAQRKFDESTKFLETLKTRSDGIGKTASQLAAMRAAELGVTDAAGPMIAKLKEAEVSAGNVGNAFGSMATYAKAAMAAFGAKQLLSAADQWGQLTSRMQIAAGGVDAGTAAMSRLMEMSKRVYKPIGETAELFIRTSESLKQMGYSTAETLDMVETLSYGLTVSAASGERASSVINAWSKSILKGKMDMESFTSVIAAAPRIQQALADSLGVTNAGLMQIVLSGELTAEKMLKVTSQMEVMGREADVMPVTMADAFTRMQSSLVEWAGKVNDSIGVTNALTGAMNVLSNNIGTVVTALGTLAAVSIARWLGTAAIAAGGFSAAMGGAALAVKGFIASMGPIGWAVLAIGAAATAWQMFGDRAKEAMGFGESAADRSIAAARKMAAGIGEAARDLSKELDELIKKKEQALGSGPSDLDVAQGRYSSEASRMAALGDQFTNASRRTGAYASMSTSEASRVARETSDEMQKVAFDMQSSAEKIGKAKGLLVAEYTSSQSRMSDAQKKQAAFVKAEKDHAQALLAAGSDMAKVAQVNAAYQAEIANIKESAAKGGGAAAINKEASAYATLISSIRTKTDESRLELAIGEDATEAQKIRIKLDQDLATGKLKLSAANRAALDVDLAAMAASQAAAQYAKDEAKFYAEQAKAKYDASTAAVNAATAEAVKNEELARTFGMTKTAIEELELARLKEQRAQLGNISGTTAEIAELEALIDAKQRNLNATSSIETQEIAKKANEVMAADWTKTIDDYSNVFRLGFADMLNNGKSGWKSFTKSLTTTFKTSVADQIYKMFAQPFVVKMVASILGVTGSGLASAADLAGGASGSASSALSLMSTAKNIYSAFTGGFASAGAAISNLGVELGSEFIANFGHGFAGNAGFGSNAVMLGQAAGWAAGIAGGYFAGKMISGEYSAIGKSGNTAVLAGTAIGAIFGGPIGAVIGGAIGGVVNRAFGMGKKKPGDTSIVGNFGDSGFSGGTETPWTQKGGWFRSNKAGVDYGSVSAEFTSFMTDSFNLMKTGAAALAASVGVSADALAGFSQRIRVTLTNDAEKNQELIANALSSVGDGMVTALIPSIASYAKEGEKATQTLERLSSSITTTNAWLSMMRQRLFQVSLAGADAAAKLADIFGGLENFNKVSTEYFRLYYTEGEQAAAAIEGIAASLEAVSISAPRSMFELRSMASALDLNTESGRAAYATLLAIAPQFAATAEVIQRLAQDAAESLMQAFTGRGQLMPALDSMSLKVRILKDTLIGTYSAAGNISTLFLDMNSGLISFGGSAAVLGDSLTGAQEASALLSGQIASLRLGAAGAIIDIAGLNAALANVNTETFVATIALAFQNLADRISGVLDDIAEERIAVREAALQIINPTVMSKAAIESGIAGINTGLPSNAGAVSANAALNAAITAQIQTNANLNSSKTAADLRQQSILSGLNTTAAPQTSAPGQSNNALWESIIGPQWQAHVNRYGRGWDTRRTSDAERAGNMNAMVNQYEAQRNAINAPIYAAASSAFAESQKLIEAALAQNNAAISAKIAAEERAKTETIAYADELQNFAIDASESVGKLSKLREETVKYYEAQKALANLMAASATGLRTTVANYRYSQMSTADQFNTLQTDYAKNYAMALSTEGETLAGYGDKMNASLNTLLEKAREYYGTDAQYNVFASTAIARAESVAARLESMAPDTYQADSLSLLGQIDTTLAALDASSRSAEQLIVNAINAGRDKTSEGLRAVIAAITGTSIPAFAAGGTHLGGLRIVGENGPELEATGPSRIFNAAQTRSMLSGGNDNAEMVAELRALRQEVANLRIEARATAVNTGKVARQGERKEIEGQRVYTDADTPLHVEVTA